MGGMRMQDDILMLIGVMDGRTIRINTYSLVDLLALIITTHVMLIFLYRYLRFTKRGTDLLFGLIVLTVGFECLCDLVSDNIVHSGTPSWSVPNAAKRTLFWYRLMFIDGNLAPPIVAHFVSRYCQSRHMQGWRVVWLYVGAIVITPIYFSDWFLRPAASPLQETSNWSCAVPWQPTVGPLVSIFLLLVVAGNIYFQWLMWHRPQIETRSGPLALHTSIVWCGITVWGCGAAVSVILGAIGYARVDH